MSVAFSTNVSTIAEVASVEGVSIPRIHALIREKRVVGAKKRGIWLIPVDGEGRPEILPPKSRSRSFAKIGRREVITH